MSARESFMPLKGEANLTSEKQVSLVFIRKDRSINRA
jgi:hypothetical protein